MTNAQLSDWLVLAERCEESRRQGTVLIVNAGADFDTLPGAGDDGFNRPRVTPVPAPPDDQLIRLAKVGGILGGIATLIIARWLHKHLEIRWRS